MKPHPLAGLLACAAAACGSKATGPAPIANSAAAPADGLIREGTCPPGLLEVLAPGWPAWVLEDIGLHPQLDACLTGSLIGGASVVVYASAPPDPDSQREDGYPLRRLIMSPDGTILSEGPAGGGDWLVAAASLEALVDLDGDGLHEIVETDATSPMSSQLRVWRLQGAEWLEAGTVLTGIEDGDYTCTATWTVAAASASGARPLVVEVVERGERQFNDYTGEGMDGCPPAGTHHFVLTAGTLVDQDAPADATDAPADEPAEGDPDGEGGVYRE